MLFTLPQITRKTIAHLIFPRFRLSHSIIGAIGSISQSTSWRRSTRLSMNLKKTGPMSLSDRFINLLPQLLDLRPLCFPAQDTHGNRASSLAPSSCLKDPRATLEQETAYDQRPGTSARPADSKSSNSQFPKLLQFTKQLPLLPPPNPIQCQRPRWRLISGIGYVPQSLNTRRCPRPQGSLQRRLLTQQQPSLKSAAFHSRTTLTKAICAAARYQQTYISSP